MSDRQDWLKKKKEDAKRQAEMRMKESITRMTIDDIVLSSDGNTITSIDSMLVHSCNMVYLRNVCIKLKINGYKNKRRDEMIRLLVERKRIQIVESMHYPGEEESGNSHKSDSDDSVDVNEDIDARLRASTSPSTTNGSAIPLYSGTDNRSSTAEQRKSPSESDTSPTIDTMRTTPYASPTTRSMSRARRVLAHEDDDDEDIEELAASTGEKTAKAKKKKPAKGSIPPFVKEEATYYSAINVWFEKRNRADIMSMGESPTIQELDAWQFANKRTYDKLLRCYSDTSVENDAINYIGFGGDEYLLSCGITENHASNFDIITSRELKQVLDDVVHWYNISLRNNRTSGNHADFHQFVGCRPFVYYYHLWLMEIPHLSFLAVPVLDTSV